MPAGNAAVVAAVISASVAVVVAIGTQIWTSVRARSDRRYASRRAGLIEAQDALLELRDALAAYGPSVRPSMRGDRITGQENGPADGLVDSSGVPAPPPAQADGDAVSAAGSAHGPDRQLETRRRQTTGRFVVAVSRVHDESIVTAMNTWQSAASRRFISVEDVSASVEDQWFDYVQKLTHLALTSPSGKTGKRGRERIAEPTPLTE